MKRKSSPAKTDGSHTTFWGRGRKKANTTMNVRWKNYDATSHQRPATLNLPSSKFLPNTHLRERAWQLRLRLFQASRAFYLKAPSTPFRTRNASVAELFINSGGTTHYTDIGRLVVVGTYCSERRDFKLNSNPRLGGKRLKSWIRTLVMAGNFWNVKFEPSFWRETFFDNQSSTSNLHLTITIPDHRLWMKRRQWQAATDDFTSRWCCSWMNSSMPRSEAQTALSFDS